MTKLARCGSSSPSSQDLVTARVLVLVRRRRQMRPSCKHMTMVSTAAPLRLASPSWPQGRICMVALQRRRRLPSIFTTIYTRFYLHTPMLISSCKYERCHRPAKSSIYLDNIRSLLPSLPVRGPSLRSHRVPAPGHSLVQVPSASTEPPSFNL
jgi:hypothetical protein